MPRFQLELTLTANGSVVIEAADIHAARKVAECMNVSNVDISFDTQVEDEDIGHPFVSIDGIFEADGEEEAA